MTVLVAEDDLIVLKTKLRLKWPVTRSSYHRTGEELEKIEVLQDPWISMGTEKQYLRNFLTATTIFLSSARRYLPAPGCWDKKVPSLILLLYRKNQFKHTSGHF